MQDQTESKTPTQMRAMGFTPCEVGVGRERVWVRYVDDENFDVLWDSPNGQMIDVLPLLTEQVLDELRDKSLEI